MIRACRHTAVYIVYIHTADLTDIDIYRHYTDITDRQTDTDTHRHTDTQTHIDIYIHTYIYKHTHTHTHTNSALNAP